ncbi:hypothetical protein ACVWY2_004083 [Bradyrhizobium sp. JR6.1]
MFSTSANGFRQVVAHRDQPMAGQDEGDRRGARHIGVGLAHQRCGHVAGAVLDIEPAGDLDLLHVFPGRNRDPREPLDGTILLDGRVHQVDPDRRLRQHAEVGGGGLLEGKIGGNEHRQHHGLHETGLARPVDLARFWLALHDRAINRTSTFVAARRR